MGPLPHMLEVEVRTDAGSIDHPGEWTSTNWSLIPLGGEKAKLLKFAIMMLQHANVLILDEPTNHLDLMSKGCWTRRWGVHTGTGDIGLPRVPPPQQIPHKIIEMFPRPAGTSQAGRYEDYVEKSGNRQLFAAASRPVEKRRSQTETLIHRTKRQRSGTPPASGRSPSWRGADRRGGGGEIAALGRALPTGDRRGVTTAPGHCALLEEKRVQLAADTDAPGAGWWKAKRLHLDGMASRCALRRGGGVSVKE